MFSPNVSSLELITTANMLSGVPTPRFAYPRDLAYASFPPDEFNYYILVKQLEFKERGGNATLIILAWRAINSARTAPIIFVMVALSCAKSAIPATTRSRSTSIRDREILKIHVYDYIEIRNVTDFIHGL